MIFLNNVLKESVDGFIKKFLKFLKELLEEFLEESLEDFLDEYLKEFLKRALKKVPKNFARCEKLVITRGASWPCNWRHQAYNCIRPWGAGSIPDPSDETFC